MSRELDVALAKALGYEVRLQAPFGWLYRPDKERPRFTNIPEWRKDGNDMLALIEEMRKRGWFLKTEVLTNGKHRARFLRYDIIEDLNYYKGPYMMVSATADTFTKAVAEAAVFALTEKEWKEK